MKLSELIRHLPVTQEVPGDPEITAIKLDSRRVQPGTLFAALRGEKADGNAYIDAALAQGAAAILSDREPSRKVPWLKATDARVALALAAWMLEGRPDKKLRLIGVTGTNGKTTVSHLIQAILNEGGPSCGLLGTITYDWGTSRVPAWRTTPEAPDLAEFFKMMVRHGLESCVMEVSSHALALKRVHGLEFAAAVFTNLTRDHLDFHATMENYFEAKRQLFSQLAEAGIGESGGVAAVGVDDDWGIKLASLLEAHPGVKFRRFGHRENAEIRPLGVALDLQGIRGEIHTPSGILALHSPLLGEPNLQNILAAVAACEGLGVPLPQIAAGLANVAGVPGRFERIEAGQPFSVVVDYAHTDDALKNCLATLRQLGARRLITVFGCGGGRDRGKRPLMGAVAMRLSDLVILTSDNPRDEDPLAIARDVEPGIRAELRGGKRHETILDRTAAIARALEMARAGDVVAICGKGHETMQTIAGVDHPFNDAAAARAGLEALKAKDGLFVGQ